MPLPRKCFNGRRERRGPRVLRGQEETKISIRLKKEKGDATRKKRIRIFSKEKKARREESPSSIKGTKALNL